MCKTISIISEDKIYAYGIQHTLGSCNELKILNVYWVDHYSDFFKEPQVKSDIYIVCSVFPKESYDGLCDFIVELRSKLPDKIICVITNCEEHCECIHTLKSGVNAYINQDIDINGFLDILEQISQGRIVISNEMSKKIIEKLSSMDEYNKKISRSKKRDLELLSNQEKIVYRLIEQGLSNKGIADALFISEHTVKVHVSNIMKRLNVHNRSQILLRLRESHEEDQIETKG